MVRILKPSLLNSVVEVFLLMSVDMGLPPFFFLFFFELLSVQYYQCILIYVFLPIGEISRLFPIFQRSRQSCCELLVYAYWIYS
jgi:hypothetical protein